MPSVQSVHIAKCSSDPMESMMRATLLAGRGIEGDRYASNKGTYSVLRDSKVRPGERELGRQLTMISADGATACLEKAGLQVPGGDLGNLRRNIVLEGVPEGDLLKWLGKAVWIGDTVVVFCHRHCVPCMYNERLNDTKGLMETIWNEAGVSCEILIGGEIKVGDEIVPLSAEELQEACPGRVVETDTGPATEAFLLRPTQRSAHMIHESLNARRSAHVKLSEIDPVGVERLEGAYNSVDLSFFPDPLPDGPPVVMPLGRRESNENRGRNDGREMLHDRTVEGEEETRRSSDAGLFMWDFSDSDSNGSVSVSSAET